MTLFPSQVVPVGAISDVGTARRQAVALAEDSGCRGTECGRVALVATELATNLVRHADGGQLLLQLVMQGGEQYLEVVSIDNGPGLDIAACMRDGFSSGGTSGNGLGAVRRLSAEFDLYSSDGKGCIVLSRVQVSPSRRSGMGGAGAALSQGWRLGALAVAAPGETVVGDTWRLIPDGQGIAVMVADGLGHGPLASNASEAAAEIFSVSHGLPTFFNEAHVALRPTRGAAVAAAICPAESGFMRYLSIGNVTGSILTRGGEHKRLLSENGTVGMAMRPREPMDYAWQAGDRLVLHSDGISARWTSKEYPDHMHHHPAVLSALLFRDQGRGRDDATVVVLEYVA